MPDGIESAPTQANEASSATYQGDDPGGTASGNRVPTRPCRRHRSSLPPEPRAPDGSAKGALETPTIDSDILIDALRSRSGAKGLPPFVRHGSSNWRITPHVLFELFRGAAGSRDARREFTQIEKVGEFCRFLPFDKPAARMAARMAAFLDRDGLKTPERDIFIAASTLVWGDATILTRDREHFSRLTQFGLIVLDEWGAPIP